jgi:hypothetical protein
MLDRCALHRLPLRLVLFDSACAVFDQRHWLQPDTWVVFRRSLFERVDLASLQLGAGRQLLSILLWQWLLELCTFPKLDWRRIFLDPWLLAGKEMTDSCVLQDLVTHGGQSRRLEPSEYDAI